MKIIFLLFVSLLLNDKRTKCQIFYPEDLNEFPTYNIKTFDNYNNDYPDLEDHVEICNAYQDENCATLWFYENNEIMLRNKNRITNALFRYSLDPSDSNLQTMKTMRKTLKNYTRKIRKMAKKFQWETFQSSRLKRLFDIIKISMTSDNEEMRHNISIITNKINKMFRNASACFNNVCLGAEGIRKLFRNETDYDKLAGFWTGWMNAFDSTLLDLFFDKLNLRVASVQENGFQFIDGFDFKYELEYSLVPYYDLNQAMEPLYKQLHAYVRYCLVKKYPGKFPKDGPIPIHILGHVHGQHWTNIFKTISQCMGIANSEDYMREANKAITKMSIMDMVNAATNTFQSAGMFNMTEQFWNRSVFEKPKGKNMKCYSSAYDFYNGRDFRIFMCLRSNIKYFTKIYRKIIRIQYFMAYRNLPALFRKSANTFVHEAIGETISLSFRTPQNLQRMGLISNIPNGTLWDVAYLMKYALEKIVFARFSLMTHTFRITKKDDKKRFNNDWYSHLRSNMGLMPYAPRKDDGFDIGSKYQVAQQLSSIRYLYSIFIQYQLLNTSCAASGHTDLLHKCNFLPSTTAMSSLLEMLKQGKSQNWQKTLKDFTGSDLNPNAALQYFNPLLTWLQNENTRLNNKIGW